MSTVTSEEKSKVSLLIVEDDVDDFYIVKELLQKDEHTNYEFFHTGKLHSAVYLSSQRKIDVILLDLNIEDSEGLDTLKKIIRELPDTPIVVLTGLNEEQVGRKAIQNGATDYIPKAHATTYLLSRAITYGIERNRLISEIKKRAEEDCLTGLPNRASLFKHLHTLIEQSKRSDTKLAMGMLDLDNFKKINDEHGHIVGDKLLIEVSNRLQSALRASDYLARLAGDEFIILITNYKNEEELLAVLEKKREAVAQPLEVELQSGKIEIKVSCSIGVVEWNNDCTIETFINLADSQLYEGKRMGKDRVSFISR